MPGTESVSHHDLVVCACGEQEYTAGDAIDAAIFRGELDKKWEKFLHVVAAENRADELEVDLDEAAISAAAEAFRYQHDLITAEETETWLANRGLTFDDFSDYFTREYCASAVRENISPEKVGYDSAAPELRELFVADLILSGELDHMTTQLIWRLAARCAEKEITPDAVSAEERSFLDRAGIKRAQLGKRLERLGRDATWFNEMLALESAYRRRYETLVVPLARKRELAILRLPLTRFETDVLEPLARGDGFELCRIISKVEPQPDDPTVKSRIDQRLLARHFSELASRYLERRIGGVSA